MEPKDDIEYQLSQLLDGDLPAEQAKALLRRMESDPALADQFRRYRALEAGLGELAEQMPAVDWEFQRESIRAALERESLLKPALPAWPGRVIRWSTRVAAMAAVVAVAGLIAWHSS